MRYGTKHRFGATANLAGGKNQFDCLSKFFAPYSWELIADFLIRSVFNRVAGKLLTVVDRSTAKAAITVEYDKRTAGGIGFHAGYADSTS